MMNYDQKLNINLLISKFYIKIKFFFLDQILMKIKEYKNLLNH
jgi:hypothetical protein